jgi:hypothetical protein
MTNSPPSHLLEQHKTQAKAMARDYLLPFVESVEGLAARQDTSFGDKRKLDLVAQAARTLIQRIGAL